MTKTSVVPHGCRCAVLVVLGGTCLLTAAAAATPKSVTFWGTITNTAYLPNRIQQGVCGFRVVVEGSSCAFDVTNRESRTHWHATLRNGEYRFAQIGPYTNSLGEVSTPVAARMERRLIPSSRDWLVSELWLAFACHSYFTNRSDLRALPIWPLGPDEADAVTASTKAVYSALPGSAFPGEVSYFTDGGEYFRGQTAGTIQNFKLPPPFDAGFTNYSGRATSTTNTHGLLLPLVFEINRHGVKWGGSKTVGLRMVSSAVIAVSNVAIDRDTAADPEFEGEVTVLDYRNKGAAEHPKPLFLRMTNGIWPDALTVGGGQAAGVR